MKKKSLQKIKLLVIICILGVAVWLIVKPIMEFHKSEEKLREAAERYFELHSSELPTGERVKTISLSTLYHGSYLKEDIYIPYTQKACSIEKSWVKVRKESGHYKYYVYLNCGILNSNVDHTGPKIRLKGETNIQMDLGDEFKDPGIHSVVDDRDGTFDIKDVTIKGTVDTSRIGTYEIKYSATDSLNNKETVTRTVTVVKTLIGAVKSQLENEKNYKGNPQNNYVRLSNMYFRILGYDDNDNVILVSEEAVSYINFNKITKWLDEVYMPHLTDEAKKMLVKTKFCNMKISKENKDTTKCTSFTEERYVYVPSVIDINLARSDMGNFVIPPYSIDWTANAVDGKKAFASRSLETYDIKHNYGIRPKLVIKGDSLVVDGDGSHDYPFSFGETKKAKGGESLNKRYTGEYIVIDDIIWRIIEVEDDGTTKVISDSTLGTNNFEGPSLTASNPEDEVLLFDIKDKNNYAYFINNNANKFVNTSYFVAHDVAAPVYKDAIIFGEESKTNTFKLKISPPNMYDLFSAWSMTRSGQAPLGYWLINSSTSNKRIAGAVTNLGIPANFSILNYEKYGIRAVAYVKKGVVISSGEGTSRIPYKLK